MIKINYNRNNPLAYRFISHLDQSEANELISRSRASRDSRNSHSKQQLLPFGSDPRKKSQLSQHAFSTQQTKIIADFNNHREMRDFGQRVDAFAQNRFGETQMNNRKMKRSEMLNPNRKDSQDFLEVALFDFSNEQRLNVPALRQAYLRVWFEKIALENNHAGLIAELNKKDEVINQLKQEVEQKNGQAPIFYNPQGPLQMANQNKTAILPSQSVSMSSQANHQAPTSMSHWGGMHPSRNFNVATTRSHN